MLQHYRILLALCGFVLAGSPAYGQQACTGNQDLEGHFGFVANRLTWTFTVAAPPGTNGNVTWIPVTVTPPGTTGEFTTTAVGRLAFGALGAGPFSAVGRVLADGAGTLYTPTGFTPVGTYTVSPDCSVRLSIRDAESENPTIAAATAQFSGVLQERGNAVSLVQTNAGLHTRLELARPYVNLGCTEGSVSGSYGVSVYGVQLFDAGGGASSPPGVTPFALVGRVFADGAGGFVADPAASGPAEAGTFTGTYEVNDDCTGTARLNAGEDINFSLSFLLTPPSIPLSPGIGFNVGAPSRAVMNLAIGAANVSGLGSGR